ncbi:Adenylate and Guanylate cyclase catalytic domain-containing protein [Devosia sp. YR412]|uniref:adenylate/guanylate cyclase domain-containing protein n=1 Tax=Devosia sp. YR412 TaxID=1881030 RepID=UPI0008AD5150|nr:adenylate/guanylate cyclase domain-containing protein [Devosia sp. YR412]SEQ38055.1 Adenylate and Guanylate cyclase catalytic domain-containing protein [Devosia sp. YR412]
MAIAEDLKEHVKNTFRLQWSTSGGSVVPDETKVTLSNTGVYIDATVLYADMADSTKLVDSETAEFAGEIYKTFLNCAARIIKYRDGTITAYDGDRVMAVFVGGSKNSNAVKAALSINWARLQIIQPALDDQYGAGRYTVHHTVGVDTSKLLVAKAGVRNSNDLVWIGRAANWAAKLTTLDHGTPTRITGEVYDQMSEEARTANGVNMWDQRSWTAMANHRIYGSTWRWSL